MEVDAGSGVFGDGVCVDVVVVAVSSVGVEVYAVVVVFCDLVVCYGAVVGVLEVYAVVVWFEECADLVVCYGGVFGVLYVYGVSGVFVDGAVCDFAVFSLEVYGVLVALFDGDVVEGVEAVVGVEVGGVDAVFCVFYVAVFDGDVG